MNHRTVKTAAAELLRPPRCRPTRSAGLGTLHRRPAVGGDRQGPVLRRLCPHHGRARRRRSPAARWPGCSAWSRALREQRSAVLFISHRLEEIFELCQRVTTLRDGAWIASEPLSDLDEDGLVRRMVGRDPQELYPKQQTRIGEVALSVRRLTREGVFTDVSFDVRRGEILGLAGLVGAGRSEVARAVFGVDRFDGGEVEVLGRKLPPGAPSLAMAAGLALVPEDRRAQGLGDGHVHRAEHRADRLRGHLPGRADEPAGRAQSRRGLGDEAPGEVRAPGRCRGDAPGGNQQKVVLANGRHGPPGADRGRTDPRYRRGRRRRCTVCRPRSPPTGWRC
ncbi:ATP-binding cassette domain-containing protein [Streptomyces thinghirensis]|nr:ATP-binding cassette domain-containing protein [Streptomyces thinghirensis]